MKQRTSSPAGASSNMLLILIFLAAERVVNAQRDIESCPVNFYGKVYNFVYERFSGPYYTVCFKGFYRQPDNDCLLIKYKPASGASTSINSTAEVDGGDFKLNLPSLTGESSCGLQFSFLRSPLNTHTVILRQFGKQSAIKVFVYSSYQTLTWEIEALVGGRSIEKWATSNVEYRDTTACRLSGFGYKQNTTSCKPDGSGISCDGNLDVTVVPEFPQCPQPPKITCTVIGSSVIDFWGQVSFVPDRCAYTLISESGVQLLAFFKDRRRKDVGLLDSLTLRLAGPQVDFRLGQGGRVQLNDSQLTIGSSPLSLHGVELSKDQRGVTAKFLLSNYNTSVFFDGYTAQIRTTVLIGKNIPGLCGNSTLQSSEVSPEFSSSSCGVHFPEPTDSSINCNMMTQRCNLLREASFSPCHNYTDPEPFIAACNDTLCRYPAVDALGPCHFLEAYVRACSFRMGKSTEGWRSKAGCSSPEAFCQDTHCSDHEFCSQDFSGKTSCFCRAIFASKYRSSGALGEPTICVGGSASVSLVGCLLEEKGLDYSELHLNDQSCRGQRDNETHTVTFSFDGSSPCGTVVTSNNSQVIYKNSIKMQNDSGIITRTTEFIVDFSCLFNQPEVMSMAFRLKDSSVIQQMVSGAWNYSLTMKAYRDTGLTLPIEPNTELMLEQTVWVELKTDTLDGKLVALVTDSCWATNVPSPDASLRYNLIVNGCPNPTDQTVKVQGNGQGTSTKFAFNMFHFSGKSGDVFLHCKLNLCLNKGNTCAPSCEGLRRRRSSRSKYEDGSPAFITMAWTN